MRQIIIIPARGGSKGIPRKNLRNLAGKPLVFYSVSLAIKIPESTVYLNTDDNEIANVVKNQFPQVNIYMRNSFNSSDEATIDQVIFEQMSQMDEIFDNLIVLQPTSPLLKYETVIKALSTFNKSKFKSCMAVSIFKHLLWKGDDINGFKLIQNERLNRQQMEPLFLETGAFTFTKLHKNSLTDRIDKDPYLFSISEIESIDVDTQDDWVLAERALNNNKLFIELHARRKL